jgi:dolichyl-diphosphooligosaccharide--protein glycosyltransferase
MIPLHALALTLMGRFTNRLYVGYSSWYAIGTLASMQVPFVGFQPVSTSEHMGALGIPEPDFWSFIFADLFSGVFGLLQIVAFVELVRSHVSSKQFQQLLFGFVIVAGILGTLAIVGLTYKGWIAPWTGRFYSLWDTGYAKKWVILAA